MDLVVAGKQGLSIIVHLEAQPSSKKSTLQLYPHYIRVNIDRLKIHFHSSRHDSLYTVIAPLVALSLKRSVETAIAERIIQGVELFDSALKHISKSA